jgi:hypothetical protein
MKLGTIKYIKVSNNLEDCYLVHVFFPVIYLYVTGNDVK